MPQLASRGPGRPPAAKADDTRKRIVRAARQVFSERGYDGATFQAIAVRADLTRPAINHYFPSKRVLYTEVADRTNELVVTAGIERARCESTLAGRLGAFIAVALEADAQNPCTAAFLSTAVLESQRHPELKRDDNDAISTTREFLVSAVDDAIASGEIAPDTDAAVLAEALVMMLCGIGFYAGFVGTYSEVENILGTLQQLMAGSLWRARVQQR
ncbi:TetR family transcriptional regulator [Mycobacterium gordonae]|uniref:TetR family transcriptional regulator n=1 Tax=Mycobacterium gordonae TaxID=1778 RepID=A0A0Q2UKY1_MYCGO|nr:MULTISPECIES: TetR/AcrR family transcriptional regulator [Mycobacterium]KQH81320.1 TetR family transcriptional regulator [Mycobacterium gordonae]MDP7730861.1 TetR/AcrR family transcriptional regulator [Mycobacterium sp. TY813]